MGHIFLFDIMLRVIMRVFIPFTVAQFIRPFIMAVFKMIGNTLGAPFLDIGTPESLPQAEGFIQKHLAQFAV